MADLREMVSERVGESLKPLCESPLDELQQYCRGAEHFVREHGSESTKIQAGRLF